MFLINRIKFKPWKLLRGWSNTFAKKKQTGKQSETQPKKQQQKQSKTSKPQKTQSKQENVSKIKKLRLQEQGEIGIEDYEEQDEKQEQQAQKQKLDQKLQSKSAALYQHYLKTRQRPMLTLDSYQICYVYVIQRPPIFVPYHPKNFEYYRSSYHFSKITGYYPKIPKQLQLQTGDYLFQQYERINPENQWSHVKKMSKSDNQSYAENSRYWRYTDPSITDPKSVQTHSSDNVYFIVKNTDNKWIFPRRVLTQKDSQKQIFKVINSQLFGKFPNPIVYFPKHVPIYARKIEDATLDRGKGYYEYFFKGLSINGSPKFPTSTQSAPYFSYLDYAWVPKPLLSQYFDDEYFNSTIKLTVHLC